MKYPLVPSPSTANSSKGKQRRNGVHMNNTSRITNYFRMGKLLRHIQRFNTVLLQFLIASFSKVSINWNTVFPNAALVQTVCRETHRCVYCGQATAPQLQNKQKNTINKECQNTETTLKPKQTNQSQNQFYQILPKFPKLLELWNELEQNNTVSHGTSNSSCLRRGQLSLWRNTTNKYQNCL